jgi:hypothetical protein
MFYLPLHLHFSACSWHHCCWVAPSDRSSERSMLRACPRRLGSLSGAATRLHHLQLHHTAELMYSQPNHDSCSLSLPLSVCACVYVFGSLHQRRKAWKAYKHNADHAQSSITPHRLQMRGTLRDATQVTQARSQQHMSGKRDRQIPAVTPAGDNSPCAGPGCESGKAQVGAEPHSGTDLTF